MIKAVIWHPDRDVCSLGAVAPLSSAGVPDALATARRSAVGILRRPVGESRCSTFGVLAENRPKEAFIATGVVSAVIVDAARLVIYGTGFMASHFPQSQAILAPVIVGMVCAFIGSFAGTRMLPKITLRTVQIVVAVAMLLIGTGLGVGLV
jgi:hypothetical protein